MPAAASSMKQVVAKKEPDAIACHWSDQKCQQDSDHVVTSLRDFHALSPHLRPAVLLCGHQRRQQPGCP
jgi:hypothetical protein